MRIVILAALVLALSATPSEARCLMSYCKDETSTPSRSYIVNTSRQKVGDVYSPGHGRRLQIRDNSRRIIGYIEADGRVTNTSRQTITLDALQDD